MGAGEVLVHYLNKNLRSKKLATRILKVIIDQSHSNWNNLENEDNVPTLCPSCINDSDSIMVQVRAWAGAAKQGFGEYAIYNVDDIISPRVSQFNRIKVRTDFSVVGEDSGGEVDTFLVKIGIITQSKGYMSDYFGGPGNYEKSWDLNPYTGIAWTKSDINGLYIQFIIYIPEGPTDPHRKGKIDYFRLEVTYIPVIPVVSTKVATNITNSSAMLNGEITDDGGECTERGFEYYKDGEPENVITIKEEGEFGDGVYGLTAGGLLAGTEYHFRAYALNEADIAYGGWKDFVTTALPPTVSTQDVTDIIWDNAVGHGTIITTGGQPGIYKCVERGFEVKLEYKGSMFGHKSHYFAGFSGDVYLVIEKDEMGFWVDFYWEGTLIKTVSRSGSFDANGYELELAPSGTYIDTLFALTSYSCRAYAINEDGLIGYGNWVDFTTTALLYTWSTVVGRTTEIKNVTVQNLEEGEFATRIGIRYGTTSSAHEFDIHIDGEFGNGTYEFVLSDLFPNTEYYQVPYILIGDGGGVHEGSLVESETLPEVPEEEFTTPYYGPHGQDYREVVKKVFAEKLASQSIIDFSGGKKTLKLNNHLVQVQSNALVIVSSYLDRFQFAKTKLVVGYPTPMPFEREDTIDFDYGRIRFKLDGEGVIPFKADGQGQMSILNMVSVIVRKINLKMGITEKTVEYLATLELEEE